VTKTVNFCLPRLGGAESDARILVWKKAPGESFKADESILEVETDKAVVEVPAPCDGVMGQHLAAVDTLVEFDQALAEISVSGGAAEPLSRAALAEPAAALAQATVPSGKAAEKSSISLAITSGKASLSAKSLGATGRRTATPIARKLAAQLGVDLSLIEGLGPNGRIVRDDIFQQAAHAPTGVKQRVAQSTSAATSVEKMIRTPHGEISARFWNAPGQKGAATILLVHGLFGDIDTWAGLAASLAGQGRSVVAFDLPAHGKSPAAPLTIDKIVAALAQVIGTLPAGPKVLVGHSLGGAIVTRLAASPAVKQVSSVALIAPAGLGTEINQSFIDGMLNAGSTAVLRRELEKLAVRLPAFGNEFMTDLVASLKERSSALEELVSDLSSSGVQQIDIRGELEQLQMPVSIFWGRQDQIIPWSHALNAPPKIALHLISGVGHMPQWESSNLVLDRLLQMGLFVE
jgi:pyruvate dehydrogenase E2 component (dihydrolipoamide acetyltransferase)